MYDWHYSKTAPSVRSKVNITVVNSGSLDLKPTGSQLLQVQLLLSGNDQWDRLGDVHLNTTVKFTRGQCVG